MHFAHTLRKFSISIDILCLLSPPLDKHSEISQFQPFIVGRAPNSPHPHTHAQLKIMNVKKSEKFSLYSIKLSILVDGFKIGNSFFVTRFAIVRLSPDKPVVYMVEKTPPNLLPLSTFSHALALVQTWLVVRDSEQSVATP